MTAWRRLAKLRAAFAPQPNQVGAAFAIDGQIAGLDLFDAPDTLAKLMPKLIDSYAFDAIEVEGRKAKPPSLDKVRQLLARIAGADARVYKSVAKGDDVRIESRDVQAALLVDGNHIVHMSAFETAEA